MPDFVAETRKYLLTKLINSTDGFHYHEKEQKQLINMLKNSILHGASNSALIIGPRGSGKTTLMNHALTVVQNETDIDSNAILIKLHGLVHTDDKLALNGVTSQLNLESAVGERIFGTFAENLSFLLACLKSGQRETSKSLIFILEEFDLFCSHNNQTLLYNLLDMVQSAQTSICVIGLTCRLDVTELFEKRVKSRFSHRQIYIFPSDTDDNDISAFQNRLQRIQMLLSFTSESTAIKTVTTKKYRDEWNRNIKQLVQDQQFVNLMQRLYDITVCERILKNILIVIVSKLKSKGTITLEDFVEEIRSFEKDDKVSIVESLSILELCLVIAMKHHVEIYDNDSFNFEMIFTRYSKFANANALMQSVQKSVALKAFEHLQSLELISPVSNTSSHTQKEYRMFKLLLLPNQITDGIKLFTQLPTEIRQWASSSLV